MHYTKKTLLVLLTGALLVSCHTTNLEKETGVEPEKKKPRRQVEKDAARDHKQQKDAAIEEELKEVDMERTVIYVDRPVSEVMKEDPPPPDPPPLTGADSVAASFKESLQIPMRFVNGIMYYPWDDSFVYEIHCQPYRTTDIELEPGEQVIEMPFLSEEKVWEIGAGVSQKNGQDVQHFFVKPAYSKLTTSMIIITDRRVYHLLLKSFADRFMVMVQWTYPSPWPFTVKTNKMDSKKGLNSYTKDTSPAALVDPAFLSFDYKMKYSIFSKPNWIPQRVYDDGSKTYIQLDDRILHSESPVLFNKRNEVINYRVNKNLIIIDELIEKVTLRINKDKVTIYKKKYNGVSPEEEEEIQEDEG
jgi:type IV secretion system protein VirB9